MQYVLLKMLCMLAISDSVHIGVFNIRTLTYNIYRPMCLVSTYLKVHTKSVLLIRGTYYQYWLTWYSVRICTKSTCYFDVYFIDMFNIFVNCCIKHN